MCLEFVFLLDKCGSSESAETGGSGFALSTKGIESKLCDDGTNKGTGLDGKCVCFTSVVGSHVFHSMHLICWFSTGCS